MKKSIILMTFLVLFSCSEKTKSIEEIKADFGTFENETIKLKPIDYTKTPVYNSVKHHPDMYAYLDKVDISSIGHISDGLFLTGLMVEPKQSGTYPIIIFNRGGNRDLGSLLVATAVNVMAPLAAEGYIVVATNYRGNSRSEGTEQFGGEDINDISNLINSMAEIEKADTSRVGLWGISRGGMMNYITLKKSYTNNIKAVVNIGGITDLALTIKYHPEIEQVAEELIPNFETEGTSEIQKRSAIHWTDELPKTAPILILHGMNDQHVAYSQIPAFTDSLESFGVPFKSVSFENGNHGLIEYRNEVRNQIKNWFDRYLKNSLEFDEPAIRLFVK
ncbi:MAG: alpha/beta hydrolase family protein [Candidatus Cyclobacteriaceae bacterium M3_2C_046]